MTEISCYKISGRVQRVGFRRWCVNKAQENGISGYVCNLENGDVLVCMSASAEKEQYMLALLYKGPFLARVDKIEKSTEYLSYFPPIESGVFRRI